MYLVSCVEMGLSYSTVFNGYGVAKIYAQEAKEHGCTRIEIWERKELL